MKRKSGTLIFILLFIAGLSLLLYPSISNYWNSVHASEAVSTYRENTDALTAEEYEDLRYKAEVYNDNLFHKGQSFYLSDEEQAEYQDLLNLGGNGVMGYIEIESIGVELPIYHGTAESVLQHSVGHLDWTSLPVGGENTHCVLSGHRGLPSAKLFTNLDKLEIGDVFTITVLDKTITYEVDQIKTVEPHEINDLTIEPGKDLCTLFTCTPYGINTHRLLVRGHRVKNASVSLKCID